MQLFKFGLLIMISICSFRVNAQTNLFEAILSNDLVALSCQYLKNTEANQLLTKEGYGVLAFAVANGQSASVKVLLDLGIDLNKSSQKGTAMHAAVERGNMELVKILVDYGANINALDIRDRSPLIIATLNRNTEVVNYLLSLNADLQLRDIHKMTAMDYERKIAASKITLISDDLQLTYGTSMKFD